MKSIVAAALLCLSGLCHGAANAGLDLPEGVKYTPAGKAQVESASARLRAALTGDATALAALMGPDEDAFVYLGPYLAIEVDADGLDGRKLFARPRYHLPVPNQDELIVEGFAAKDPRQKLLLAHYLHLVADFSGPLVIREPTFDELAITWAWIAWDLDGPLLIAESEHDTYLFDFDPANGFITWMERLTKPCFSGLQEGKQVLSCTCTGVERDGRRWRLSFQVQASCPATGLHHVSAVARHSDATMPIAYIEVDDRTARMDARLAQSFGADFAINVLATGSAGFKGPGKLLSGAPPVAPQDARGEPIHGYVVLGSVIAADGRAVDNRVLISTDERASAAALEAAKEWRLEPATRDGKPVAEIVWQQLTF